MGSVNTRKKPSARPVNAVGYVRMSSDQQDASPEQQREHILRLAEKSHCRIIDWYEDLAISGDDVVRRHRFRRMVADAATGAFEKIVCWSQDRFGRFDSIEAGEWVAPLRRAGVTLVTVSEGEINWNDAVGRLIYTIQQEGKHTFLVDLARAVLRGSQKRAGKPGFCTGKTPYGFDKLVFDETGKLQRRLTRMQRLRKPKDWTVRLTPSLEVQAIQTIRWLFRTFDRTKSLRGVVINLNKRRIPSPEGKHWRTKTVHNMLTNPVYVGDQAWNRKHCGKYVRILGGDVVKAGILAEKYGPVARVKKLNQTEDWIIVRNAHPALIDRNLFDRVNKVLLSRSSIPPPRRNDPLSGMAFCGHCGSVLVIFNRRAKHRFRTSIYCRLECATARVKGQSVCKYRSIAQPKLLRLVTTYLRERVLDDQFETRLRANLAAESTNRISSQGSKPHTKPLNAKQTIDKAVADAMAQVARFRVALSGNDSELLNAALRGLVQRVVIWFGRHPRIRGASKITAGKILLASPYVDATTDQSVIDFTRADFDRLTANVRTTVRSTDPRGRKGRPK